MAIAFVNGGTHQAGSGTSDSITYTATPGNIIVANIGLTAGFSNLSVTDGNNVAFTAGPTATNTRTAAMFYYTVPGGGNGGSIKASWTGSVFDSFWIAEYSGALGGVNPVGQSATGATSPGSISITSTGSNSFLVGVVQTVNAAVAITVGNPRESIGTSGPRGVLGDNTAANSGSSIALTGTFSNQAWIGLGIELLANAAASSGVANGLMMLGCGI